VANDTIERIVTDHARQLAGLRRPESDAQTTRALKGLRRVLPWRRGKLRQLANRYRAIALSPLFDREWYLANNPDVVEQRLDPIMHYLLHGAEEGRAPGPNFDAAAYLKANPDLVGSRVNPLEHFTAYGIIENRRGAGRVQPHQAADFITDADSSRIPDGTAGSGAD